MPPYCIDHSMYYRLDYVDGLPLQQLVCVKCSAERLSGFDLPQAIKSTEQPSKAVAVEGILTEEELKEWEEDTRELLPAVSEYRIKRLIGSNRSTLSANAELSFYKKRYWEALNSIVNGHWTSYLDDDKLRVWQTDRINPKQIALEALEETK